MVPGRDVEVLGDLPQEETLTIASPNEHRPQDLCAEEEPVHQMVFLSP